MQRVAFFLEDRVLVQSLVKRKFGDSLRSKTDTAMLNETLAKFLAQNLVVVIHEMYERSIDPIFGTAPQGEQSRHTLRFPG